MKVSTSSLNDDPLLYNDGERGRSQVLMKDPQQAHHPGRSRAATIGYPKVPPVKLSRGYSLDTRRNVVPSTSKESLRKESSSSTLLSEGKLVYRDLPV